MRKKILLPLEVLFQLGSFVIQWSSRLIGEEIILIVIHRDSFQMIFVHATLVVFQSSSLVTLFFVPLSDAQLTVVSMATTSEMAQIIKQQQQRTTVSSTKDNVGHTTGSSTLSDHTGRWSPSRWTSDISLCGDLGSLFLSESEEKSFSLVDISMGLWFQ